MNAYKIAVLPGDGIGPEVVEQGIKALKAVAKKFGFTIETKYGLIGATAIDKAGNPLPEDTLNLCNQSDAILLGAVGHPKYDNDPTAKIRPEQGLLKLRKSLGLYANIRPVTTYEVLYDRSPLKRERIEGVDFVVIRELTGGIYFGEKGRNENGSMAYDQCTYSRFEIDRIARLAFKMAQNRNKKVCLVDKANVLETSRLWRETVGKIATEPVFSDIELSTMFVDNAAMQIIQWPKQFDVILTENMFGDILSDEASVLTGSMGMLPSSSIGAKVALFEPIHGSYPQAAGKNMANPFATILSVAMMLDFLAEYTAAEAIRQAVDHALKNKFATEDIFPLNPLSTSDLGNWVSDFLAKEV
jgi:3-isopropylmalate dehydrogenase